MGLLDAADVGGETGEAAAAVDAPGDPGAPDETGADACKVCVHNEQENTTSIHTMSGQISSTTADLQEVVEHREVRRQKTNYLYVAACDDRADGINRRHRARFHHCWPWVLAPEPFGQKAAFQVQHNRHDHVLEVGVNIP